MESAGGIAPLTTQDVADDKALDDEYSVKGKNLGGSDDKEKRSISLDKKILGLR